MTLLIIYLLGITHTFMCLLSLQFIFNRENKEIYYSIFQTIVLTLSSWVGFVKVGIDMIKLSQSEDDSFKTLLESIDELIWISDNNAKSLYLSPQWEKYSGFSIEDLLQNGINKLLHSDDYHRIVKEWLLAKEEKKAYEMDIRYLNKEGEYLWHLVKIKPVLGKNKKIIKWIGVSVDIHRERLSMMEKMKQTKKPYLILIAI